MQAATAFAQPDTPEPRDVHAFTLSGRHWTRGEWRYGALPSETGEKQARFLMSSTGSRSTADTRDSKCRSRPGTQVSGVPRAGEDSAWMRDGSPFAAVAASSSKSDAKKLSYDDQRIIGDNDWAMTPSKHDLLRAGFELPRHKLHLLLAYNQNSENTNGGTCYIDGGQPYKSLQTLWYHVDPFQQLGASLIFMNTGMQDLMAGEENLVCYQQLFGGFLDFHPRGFSLQASYYRQTGRDEHELVVGAWMASAEAAWQIVPRLRLNTGYFHLSGDEYFFVPP